MNKSDHPEVKVRPASNGIAWLLQSMALMRSQLARLLFLAVLLQLILGLSQVPVLGLLVILAVPGLSAGILEAFHRAGLGSPSPASVLFVPLSQRPANIRLLTLGILMFVVAAASVMLVMGGVDQQIDASLLQRIEQGDTEALAELDPGMMVRVFMAVIIAVSVSGTISFLAIPLIWFGKVSTRTAFLTGLKAMMQNWKPFSLMGVGLILLLLPVGFVFVLMLQLAAAVNLLSLVFAALIMLSALAYQLLILGTQYCAYSDIFGLDETGVNEGEAEPDDDNDGQLLA